MIQLGHDAQGMSLALTNGDFERFGYLLTRYFESKKVLNPDTTNPAIESLVDLISPLCLGHGISGAGGGGFMMFLAKDESSKIEIEARLESTNAICYDWSIA